MYARTVLEKADKKSSGPTTGICDSRPVADQMNIQDRALRLRLYTLARLDVVRELLRNTNSLFHTRTLDTLQPRLCAVKWLHSMYRQARQTVTGSNFLRWSRY
ncbi:hypothetical protein KC360_g42 [Hortaea werneckii]|nr:hypothetical protein KC344_g40 [Hortaea werneckii]KAI7180383.1 hypothetical protein KC360_g42 [Hortaea werneckii]